MSLFNVMDIAATGMHAEGIRLNTVASNVANANSVSSSYGETYKARHAVFAAELRNASDAHQPIGAKVSVAGIVESPKPLQVEYAPNHPMANEQGYIFKPNVNVVESMADMLSASKAYETNVQVADTTKRIFRRVMMLGQGR